MHIHVSDRYPEIYEICVGTSSVRGSYRAWKLDRQCRSYALVSNGQSLAIMRNAKRVSVGEYVNTNDRFRLDKVVEISRQISFVCKGIRHIA